MQHTWLTLWWPVQNNLVPKFQAKQNIVRSQRNHTLLLWVMLVSQVKHAPDPRKSSDQVGWVECNPNPNTQTHTQKLELGLDLGRQVGWILLNLRVIGPVNIGNELRWWWYPILLAYKKGIWQKSIFTKQEINLKCDHGYYLPDAIFIDHKQAKRLVTQ